MKNIEKYIDHTLLKPDATEAAIGKVCAEAIEHGFKSVCVNPARIAFAAKQLEGTGVLPCCVVGFPLGATFSKVKAFEAETAIANGAKEVDMVINIGAAKDGKWELVESDIAAVVAAAKGKAAVKVIIETCLLTDDEKEKACRARKARQFVNLLFFYGTVLCIMFLAKWKCMSAPGRRDRPDNAARRRERLLRTVRGG